MVPAAAKTADDEDDERRDNSLMQEMEKFDESVATSKGDDLWTLRAKFQTVTSFSWIISKAGVVFERSRGWIGSDADNEEIPPKRPE
jgi:hypothetical protein